MNASQSWLRRCGRSVALAGALGLAAAGATAQAPHPTLPSNVLRALDLAGVDAESLGAIVVPLAPPPTGLARLFHRGPQVWAWRADEPMQPGSTMKLVTTIVALDRLGPNLRGRTEILSAAAFDAGVLRGDLVLRGGADPEFGPPQLWQLLSELREQGITEIAGDLLLDRTLFAPPRIDQGLPPFDEAPDAAYNVIPDALLFAGNLLTLNLQSDADTLRARPWPALPGLQVDAGAVQLVDADCRDWDDYWQPPEVRDDGQQILLKLAGAFPRGCSTRAGLQLLDRNRLTELQFRRLWDQLGGRFSGRVREAAAAPGARVLARRGARPWGEVLRHLNKTSDNALTRLLFLQLGALSTLPHSAGRPTLVRADAEVRAWFAEQGIAEGGLVTDNGSGLSRSERIAPRQLARMIEAALRGRHAAELLMSLPVAGTDGTMRNRLKDSPATGWARLKTGTLRNVVALAGVVPGPAPQRLPQVLVAIVNHDNASKARPVLDALVDWVARGRPQE